MELEQAKTENPVMTSEEVSMECSKSFVKALQELKNLRPQLYSASEYCEKSYLHSEQKQMVLDNLKDYAVKALVNAVDHLGTVAYKLTDLVEQQTLDVSTMELKVSCLNQQILTCQTFVTKEGLRQHQLLAIIPRHHKHYTLPYSVTKNVHFRPHVQTDAGKTHFQARSRLQPPGSPISKTLSWHLASEMKSTLRGTPCALTSTEDPKNSGTSSSVFQLLDEESSTTTWSRSFGTPSHLSSEVTASSTVMHTFGVARRELLDGSKPLTPFRSFDNPKLEIVHASVRSRSVLSAFFVKQKTPELKASSVS